MAARRKATAKRAHPAKAKGKGPKAKGGKAKRPAPAPAAPQRAAAPAGPTRPAPAKAAPHLAPGKPARQKAAPHLAPGKPARQKAAPRPPRAALPVDAFPADRFRGVTRRDEPLARHTTFRIGGPAAAHFTPADTDDAVAALRWARAEGIPVLVLGLGSNVLVRDGGFRGLVVQLGRGMDTVVQKGDVWKVGAGLPTPVLARRTADAGAAGLHRLIGVPGSVGGGVFTNAGAHGQDFAGVLTSATVLTAAGEVKELPRKAIPFAYRRSGLDGSVVLGCTLRLEESSPARLRDEQQEYLKRRRAGTPFDLACCGSVFRNPEAMTAGRLIDRCGLKGRRVGGAVIAEQHANYIINRGNASADDVLRLIDIARTAVFKEFGIELELEVKVLGEGK
jgi:UDP-N-acetylmuramate dehydrogenase